jgi:hypothetical protein
VAKPVALQTVRNTGPQRQPVRSAALNTIKAAHTIVGSSLGASSPFQRPVGAARHKKLIIDLGMPHVGGRRLASTVKRASHRSALQPETAALDAWTDQLSPAAFEREAAV